MPNISLKNRGNGPRAVIDIRGVSHSIPVDGEEADIEVDEITETALQEGSEAGGDLEVSGGVAKRTKREDKDNEATGRAKMQTRE